MIMREEKYGIILRHRKYWSADISCTTSNGVVKKLIYGERILSLSFCAKNPKKEADLTVSTCHPSRRNRDDISRLLRQRWSPVRVDVARSVTVELENCQQVPPRRRVTVIYAYKWPGTPVHSATSTECIILGQLIIRIHTRLSILLRKI